MAQGFLVFGTWDVHTGRGNDSYITHKTYSSRQNMEVQYLCWRNTISSTLLHTSIYFTNTILIYIQLCLRQTLHRLAGVLQRNTIASVIKHLLLILYLHQMLHLPPVVLSRKTDLLLILLAHVKHYTSQQELF